MTTDQLALPLVRAKTFSRERFVRGPANESALAFLETWPRWTVSAAAIVGPAGSGKSHLAAIWRERSSARDLSPTDVRQGETARGPATVEDPDRFAGEEAFARGLFHLLEHATPQEPLLFLARTPPVQWECGLPDLKSRFSALVCLFVDKPDEAMLAAIAGTLFQDRQLTMPAPVIQQMLRSLERSPLAIEAFIAELDRRALAEKRPVTPALVRDVLAQIEASVS